MLMTTTTTLPGDSSSRLPVLFSRSAQSFSLARAPPFYRRRMGQLPHLPINILFILWTCIWPLAMRTTVALIIFYSFIYLVMAPLTFNQECWSKKRKMRSDLRDELSIWFELCRYIFAWRSAVWLKKENAKFLFGISASCDNGCRLYRTSLWVWVEMVASLVSFCQRGLGCNNCQSGNWWLKKVIVSSVDN